MAITYTIGGLDRTTYVAIGSLRIRTVLNHRDTASFKIIDTAGSYRPTVGQTIVIENGGTKIFAGSIDRLRERRVFDGTTPYEIDVECVDYNQLCDRFLVAEAYETANQTLRDIVVSAPNALIGYLSSESVTTTNVETGPVINVLVFNYKTLAECFNDIANITGYDWYIDYDRDLHFFSRETNIAPFNLTNSSQNFRGLSVETTRDQYRNRQTIRAGVDRTSSQTDSFIGDGTRKTFNLTYPCDAAPTSITVNGVSKTIGLRSSGTAADTGSDWYYQVGSREITQDSAATALTNAQTLAVTYIGQYPMLLQSRNEGQIAARAAAEGGSGLYDAIHVDESIKDLDMAEALATGFLRKFTIPNIVQYETDTTGLRPGQLQTITLTEHNLSGQYLISEVEISDVFGSTLRHQVTALSGEFQGTWVDFFRSLVAAGRRFAVRENEVIIKGVTYPDTLSFTDVLTPTSRATATARYGTAEYGYDEYST